MATDGPTVYGVDRSGSSRANTSRTATHPATAMRNERGMIARRPACTLDTLAREQSGYARATRIIHATERDARTALTLERTAVGVALDPLDRPGYPAGYAGYNETDPSVTADRLGYGLPTPPD